MFRLFEAHALQKDFTNCKCCTPGPSTSQGAGPNVASKTLVAKEAKRARGSMHHEIFIDASKLTGRKELERKHRENIQQTRKGKLSQS